MRVRILGAAAGGGFPQWNCNCPNCRAARDGSRPCRPRTQSSVAISADGRSWFLLNASPDIRTQLMTYPDLWPLGAVRQTPVQAVVLSDAELDRVVTLATDIPPVKVEQVVEMLLVGHPTGHRESIIKAR